MSIDRVHRSSEAVCNKGEESILNAMRGKRQWFKQGGSERFSGPNASQWAELGSISDGSAGA